MELNIEVYSTYNFCIMPISVLLGVLLINGQIGLDYVQWMTKGTHLNVFTTVIGIVVIQAVSFILSYTLMDMHTKSKYGKCLVELKEVMHDLEKE